MNKNDVAKILVEDNQTEEGTNYSAAFWVGLLLFIRTVTHHWTGRVVKIVQCGRTTFLVLEEAAWIASDGRFTQAMTDGTLEEVEPVPGLVWVNVDSIVDAQIWTHPLPRNQR